MTADVTLTTPTAANVYQLPVPVTQAKLPTSSLLQPIQSVLLVWTTLCVSSIAKDPNSSGLYLLDWLEQTDASPRSNFSSTASLPKSLACDQNGTTFLLTVKDLQAHTNGSKTASVALKDTPVAMSYSVAGAKVAVAGESGNVTFYSRELKEEGKKLNASGSVSALSYSPDGKWLVSVKSSFA